MRLCIEGALRMTSELKKDLLFAALGFGLGFMACLIRVAM
jgi:hypothetical protein